MRNGTSNIPDTSMVMASITYGGSTLLTGAVGTPVALTARNSSVLVEPLPDCAPVCDEIDTGLGWLEEGGAFEGWLTGTPSPGAWTFLCAVLEATDTPFLADNRIACAWRNSATIKLDYGQGQVFLVNQVIGVTTEFADDKSLFGSMVDHL